MRVKYFRRTFSSQPTSVPFLFTATINFVPLLMSLPSERGKYDLTPRTSTRYSLENRKPASQCPSSGSVFELALFAPTCPWSRRHSSNYRIRHTNSERLYFEASSQHTLSKPSGHIVGRPTKFVLHISDWHSHPSTKITVFVLVSAPARRSWLKPHCITNGYEFLITTVCNGYSSKNSLQATYYMSLNRLASLFRFRSNF